MIIWYFISPLFFLPSKQQTAGGVTKCLIPDVGSFGGFVGTLLLDYYC